MLNRRHIRIKVMQILFAYYSEEKPDAVLYEKMLWNSIERFRDLYLLLLVMIKEMQDIAIERIEAGKNKKLPSKEDLFPNTRFVTNVLLRILANSTNLEKEAKEYTISWSDNRDLLKQMFKMLTETDDYKEYMASKERGLNHDREYLLRFFRRHMINFELLHDHLEDKNIFWADDLDLASSMVLKTLKTVKEDDDDIQLLELFGPGQEEERDFMVNLFMNVLALGSKHEKLIEKTATNWETERIALMDMVLMKMALTEASVFETIPLKVTLNEYIELSKYYSTEKSGGFLNGVLDVLFEKMKKDGTIKKVGRGLVE